MSSVSKQESLIPSSCQNYISKLVFLFLVLKNMVVLLPISVLFFVFIFAFVFIINKKLKTHQKKVAE